MEQKKKIAFLVRYSQIKERVQILLERRKAYESDVYGVKATSISDMPKGTVTTDMSDRVIKLLSLTEDIDNEINALSEWMEFIRKVVKRLNNYKYLSVIEMKYIDGLQRKQIAAIMGITVIQIDRITEKAIKVLPLTEEDVEKIL